MIKEKELQELRPQVQYKKGEGITLQAIQSALDELARENDAAIAFRPEQVKYGGLLGTSEDCLVVYHPEHQKDYFSIAIRVRHQGKFAFVAADTFGVSKLMKADAVRKQVLATAKEGLNYRGFNPLQSAAAGASYVGAVGVGIHKLIKGNSDKLKLEEEQQWYSIISNLLDAVIS